MRNDKVQRKRHGLSCLSEKPSLAGSQLLGAQKATELAAVFETLANDTRLRILAVMVRDTESSTTQLAVKVGMKPQAVSNQLRRLSDRQIVERRREGNEVRYSIVDPCVVDLLQRGLWLLQDTKLRARARSGRRTARPEFVESHLLGGDAQRKAAAGRAASLATFQRKPGRRVELGKRQLRNQNRG